MKRLSAWLAATAAFLTPAWEVREEATGDDTSFCIYRRWLGRVEFLERWATLRTAGARLAELRGKAPQGVPVPADRIARACEPGAAEAQAGTPQGRMYRGSRAREVLENESFTWAFETLKTEIIQSWQNAPAQDPKGRETLWLSLKLLEKVQTNLIARLESGKMAKLELNYQKQQAENAKAWLE